MKAKVTNGFNCVRLEPGKEPEPWFYGVDDEITTLEAHQAVAEGFAEWVEPPTTEEQESAPPPQVLQPIGPVQPV